MPFAAIGFASWCLMPGVSCQDGERPPATRPWLDYDFGAFGWRRSRTAVTAMNYPGDGSASSSKLAIDRVVNVMTQSDDESFRPCSA